MIEVVRSACNVALGPVSVRGSVADAMHAIADASALLQQAPPHGEVEPSRMM